MSSRASPASSSTPPWRDDLTTKSLPRRVLPAAAALAPAALAVLGLGLAPPAAGFRAPLSQRILYLHVPAAWTAYLAYGATLAASAAHLLGRDPDLRADAAAVAAAEVGTLLGAVSLATGLLWARLEFLAYDPLEDPKVVTLVVLVAAYGGYLALRAAVDEPRDRARLAAVYGVAAFPAVPASYLASRISLHPDFTAPGASIGPALEGALLAALLVTVLLAAGLAALRYRLGRARTRLTRRRADARPREGSR